MNPGEEEIDRILRTQWIDDVLDIVIPNLPQITNLRSLEYITLFETRKDTESFSRMYNALPECVQKHLDQYSKPKKLLPDADIHDYDLLFRKGNSKSNRNCEF